MMFSGILSMRSVVHSGQKNGKGRSRMWNFLLAVEPMIKKGKGKGKERKGKEGEKERKKGRGEGRFQKCGAQRTGGA
jgi:hypothetical protein